MNIVYRIVHALLAAAVFPAVIFLQLFYMEVSPDFMDYGMSLEFSLYKIFDLFSGGSDTKSLRDAFSSESLSNIWGVFASDRAAFIMMIASAVITLVITVFVLVFSIAKGTRKVLLSVSSAGLVTSILFKVFSNTLIKSVYFQDYICTVVYKCLMVLCQKPSVLRCSSLFQIPCRGRHII